MIKGQEISTLFTISDNTPGRLSVWMIAIMLLMIRLVYLAAYSTLEKYRCMRLQTIKKQIEHLLPEKSFLQIAPDGEQDKKICPELPAPVRDENAEDAEALELFDSLKYKKRW